MKQIKNELFVRGQHVREQSIPISIFKMTEICLVGVAKDRWEFYITFKKHHCILKRKMRQRNDVKQ